MDDNWFGLDTFFLATSNVIGGILYLVSREQLKVIRNLEDVHTVEVGPSLKTLVEGAADKTLPYVAIKGQVKELGSQVIHSSTGLKAVLQSVTVKEHSIRRYSSGNWGSSVREIANTQNEVPFGLKGPSGIIVEVANPFTADHTNLLSSVKSEYHPSTETGIVEGILGFITGNRSQGVETTEKLLPVDTNMTALGRLVMSGKNRYKIMPTLDESYSPYVLTTSLKGVIERLQSQRDTVRIFSWLFFSIGIAISATKLWKLWKDYDDKRRREMTARQRRENEARLREARNAQRGPGQRASDSNANSDVLTTCVVCLENPRELILIPCGHLVCCFTCENQLNNRCPVCRSTYTDTHVAFMA